MKSYLYHVDMFCLFSKINGSVYNFIAHAMANITKVLVVWKRGSSIRQTAENNNKE